MILAMDRPTLTPADFWSKPFAIPSMSDACLDTDGRRLTQTGAAVGVSGEGVQPSIFLTGTKEAAP